MSWIIKTDKINNYSFPRYKNQLDIFMLLSVVVVTLSLFMEYIGNWFVYLVVAIAIVGIVGLIYKVIKKPRLELFDILGCVYLLIYTIGVVLIPLFDTFFFFFECALFMSMVTCVQDCKDEDTKAIAMLHVTYMFGCNLVMPCIGPSI